MKTNSKHEVMARIARGSLALAALLALVLSAAVVSRAQSSATSAPVPAARPVASPVATSGQTVPKGQHEGITVHGHWVIEVKNPDGTVTAHREFENAIRPYGGYYLAALLSGNNSPGGLSILLNGTLTRFNSGGSPLLFDVNQQGPCLPLSSSGDIQTNGMSTGTTCLIASSTSYLGWVCLPIVTTSGALNVPSPCSTNLSTVAPGFTSGIVSGASLQLVLSGNVTATATVAGMVSDVETVFTTCAASVTPSGCVNFFTAGPSGPTLGTLPIAFNIFTQRMLDGGSPNPVQADDPDPVPYMPGQLIQVTVTFSFQ